MGLGLVTTGLPKWAKSRGSELQQGPQCGQLTGMSLPDPNQVVAPGSQLQETLPIIGPAAIRGKELGHSGQSGICTSWERLLLG